MKRKTAIPNEAPPPASEQNSLNGKALSGTELFELLQSSSTVITGNKRPSRCNTHRPAVAGLPTINKQLERVRFWFSVFIAPSLFFFAAYMIFLSWLFSLGPKEQSSSPDIQDFLASRTQPFLSETFSTTVLTTLLAATITMLALFPMLNTGVEKLIFRQRLRGLLLAVVFITSAVMILSIFAQWVDQKHQPAGAITIPALILQALLACAITCSCWYLEIRNFRADSSYAQGKRFWQTSEKEKISNRVTKRELLLTPEVQNYERNLTRSTKISRAKQAFCAGTNIMFFTIVLNGFNEETLTSWRLPSPSVVFTLILTTLTIILIFVGLPIITSWLIQILKKNSDSVKSIAGYRTANIICSITGGLTLLVISVSWAAAPSLWATWLVALSSWATITLILFYGSVWRFDPNVFTLRHMSRSKGTQKRLNWWLRFIYAEADLIWAQKTRELQDMQIKRCLNQQMFEPNLTECPVTGEPLCEMTPDENTAGHFRRWLTTLLRLERLSPTRMSPTDSP